MIHSSNDPVIPYQLAEQTYMLAPQPKSFDMVGCTKHGYCTDMKAYIEKRLLTVANMIFNKVKNFFPNWLFRSL